MSTSMSVRMSILYVYKHVYTHVYTQAAIGPKVKGAIGSWLDKARNGKKKKLEALRRPDPPIRRVGLRA